MKDLFAFFFAFGIFELLYVVINFVMTRRINGALILGLMFLAAGISGLKIFEMRKRQNRN